MRLAYARDCQLHRPASPGAPSSSNNLFFILAIAIAIAIAIFLPETNNSKSVPGLCYSIPST
jgi:hypothetical protein